MDTPRSSMITAAYLEHLTAADLRLLRPDWSSAGTNEVVTSADRELEDLLGSTRVFESVFAGSDTGDPLLGRIPLPRLRSSGTPLSCRPQLGELRL